MAALHVVQLRELGDVELLGRFEKIVQRDREVTAELLAHIAELDDRKVWAAQGYSSMFAMCVEAFGMSEPAAGRRIHAARTARSFPVIFTMVQQGELNLTGIGRLASTLTQENHLDVLARARNKSAQELDELVATLDPKPDAPTRVRRVPRRRTRPSGDAPQTTTEDSSSSTSGGERDDSKEVLVAQHTRRRPKTPRRDARGATPLSPGRYKLQATIDSATRDKLRQLEDLMPTSDTGEILEAALDLLLKKKLARKAGLVDRPRRAKAKRGDDHSRKAKPNANAAPRAAQQRAGETPTVKSTRPSPEVSRAIPAAVRRTVWSRDGGRCSFVGDNGKRCGATRRLEFHHRKPYARGGRHTEEDLTLRCRAHNQYEADRDFGRAFMDGKRRRKSAAGAARE